MALYTFKFRSAYISLNKFLPYLFTYKKYPNISNTTNLLDGGFYFLLLNTSLIYTGEQVRKWEDNNYIKNEF